MFSRKIITPLNRKKSKAITWIEQELKMKYRKCKIFSNLVKIGNKAKKTSKTKILNQPDKKGDKMIGKM